jgi:hypothetical protein
MKPFAALDEVLNTQALTAPSPREIAPGDFQPLFAATPAERAGGESHGTPEIELVQADGRIQQIVLTCRCGERTVLDCAY